VLLTASATSNPVPDISMLPVVLQADHVMI